MGRWVAVQGPVPELVLERQDDLVLNAAQGRSAVHVSVAQRGVLDGAQQVGHSVCGQRLKAGRARLAGGLGVPDLQCTGQVPPIAPQEANGVVNRKVRLGGEPAEHAPFGQEPGEPCLAPRSPRTTGRQCQGDVHGQCRRLQAESLDTLARCIKVEGAPLAPECADQGSVQLNAQVTHRRACHQWSGWRSGACRWRA